MVTRAMDAYSTADSSVAAAGASVASSRAAAGAGAARTTASASSAAGPSPPSRTTRQPSAVRRSSRTGVFVRMSPPAARTASATAPGSVPTPPSMPMKTGDGAWPGSAARAAVRAWMPLTPSISERSARAASKSWGTAARIEMRYASPAYTPPSSGSTSRSTTSRPSRAATYSPTATSAPASVRSSVSSSAIRAMPSGEITPEAASRPRSPGTPMTCPLGIGRSAPRVHRAAVAVVGGWRRSPRPTARARSTASGRLASIDSAPRSTGTPAISPARSLPPSRADASSTVTRAPPSSSRWAAASPEMPPPMTTT